MTYEAEIEVNEMTLGVEIEYRVTPRYAATYWDPPEGGEIEIDDVHVLSVEGDPDCNWDDLTNLAWDAIDSDFIEDNYFDMVERCENV